MPIRTALAAVALPALLLASSVASASDLAAAAPSAPRELRFPALNRSYSDFVGAIEPIEEDPITIRLKSPTQTLILKDHKVEIVPQGDGSFAGTLTIDLLGKGWLDAEIDFAGIVHRLSDEVVVPPQQRIVAARFSLARVAGGYEVRTLSLPRELEVAVQSRIINQTLELCGQASMLTLGAVSCDGLEASLTRPKVPLPPAGETFTLADAELSAEDKALLDELIASNQPAP